MTPLKWHLSHFNSCSLTTNGLPGGASGKESACQCRRRKGHGFNPWLGKNPWRRGWQLTPVFMPGESHEMATVQSIAKSQTQLKWLSTHTGNRWNDQPHATPQRRNKECYYLFWMTRCWKSTIYRHYRYSERPGVHPASWSWLSGPSASPHHFQACITPKD